MSNSINTEGTSSRLAHMSSSAQTGAGSAAHSFKSGAHSAHSAFTGGVKKGFTGGAKGTFKLNGKLADGIRVAGRKQLTADSTTRDAAGMYDGVTQAIAHPIQTTKKSAHAVKTVGKAGVNTVKTTYKVGKATVKGTVKVAKAVRHPVKTAKQIGTNLRKAGQAVKNAPRNAVKSVKQSLTRAKKALRKAKHNVKAAAKALRHPVKTARALGNAIKKAAQAAMKAIIHGLLHLLGMLAGALGGVIAIVGVALLLLLMASLVINAISGGDDSIIGSALDCNGDKVNLRPADDYYYRANGGHPPIRTSMGDGVSPLGYYYRNCTDYVAWKLVMDEGNTDPYYIAGKYTSADGKDFATTLLNHGWSRVTKATELQHGDVVSLEPNNGQFGADSSHGHVFYVYYNDIDHQLIHSQEYEGQRRWQDGYYRNDLTYDFNGLQSILDSGGAIAAHDPRNKSEASCKATKKDIPAEKKYAKEQMKKKWPDLDADEQFDCLDQIFQAESGWDPHAKNSSGAYGIPQALPGSKMGEGWEDNWKVQIDWGLNYIATRKSSYKPTGEEIAYKNPCGAWGFHQLAGWY